MTVFREGQIENGRASRQPRRFCHIIYIGISAHRQ